MKQSIDIHELMRSKTFDALSSDEQKAVLAEMSAGEYTDQRAVLLAFEDLTSSERLPDPDATILASLRAKHKEIHAQPSVWEAFLALLFKPLPAYQMIIPSAMVLIVTLLWMNAETPLAPDTSPLPPVVETTHDTVEVIREIPRDVERIVYVDRLETLPNVSETDEGPLETIASTLPDAEALQRSYGNSGVEASTLNRLEEIAYREGF